MKNFGEFFNNQVEHAGTIVISRTQKMTEEKLEACVKMLKEKNPKASIYFYNRGRFRYEGIMLTGTMEVLQDEAIKKEIWCTGDTMYYSQGVTDPDYCVLKFTAVKGRHYCDLKTESFHVDDLE